MKKIVVASEAKAHTARVNVDLVAQEKVLKSNATFDQLAEAWADLGVTNSSSTDLYSDYVLGKGVNSTTLQIAQLMEEIAGQVVYHEILHDSGEHDFYIYAVLYVVNLISEEELRTILDGQELLPLVLNLPILK